MKMDVPPGTRKVHVDGQRVSLLGDGDRVLAGPIDLSDGHAPQPAQWRAVLGFTSSDGEPKELWCVPCRNDDGAAESEAPWMADFWQEVICTTDDNAAVQEALRRQYAAAATRAAAGEMEATAPPPPAYPMAPGPDAQGMQDPLLARLVAPRNANAWRHRQPNGAGARG